MQEEKQDNHQNKVCECGAPLPDFNTEASVIEYTMKMEAQLQQIKKGEIEFIKVWKMEEKGKVYEFWDETKLTNHINNLWQTAENCRHEEKEETRCHSGRWILQWLQETRDCDFDIK